MQLIFDGLKQYKPGEIANESKEVQAGFNSEVSVGCNERVIIMRGRVMLYY